MSEYKTIQTASSIKDKITAKLSPKVIQQRDAGKNQKLSYISGSTVIDILNTAFGTLGWNFEIVNQWMQDGVPWINKWNNNEVEEQNPIAFVHGRLTVFVKNEEGQTHAIVKESFGSKSVIGKQSEQESTFKAAQTDALKKAASLLGIGLELYRKEEEQEYYDSINLDPTWTDENKVKYAEYYSYFEDLMAAGYESQLYLDDCVAYITEGVVKTFEYVPENKIVPLYNFILDSLTDGE